MKLSVLLLPLTMACVEPPATDKAATVQPDGAAIPGAPEPGEQPGPGDTTDATTPPPVPASGPGAVVPDPGPDAPDTPPEELMAQDAITDGIQISGTLSCEGCEGTLIVRVEDATSHPPQLLTSASFTSAGSYSLKAPRDKQVVLMVIHDANSDGQPTPGESIGIWTGGLLDTSKDASDVELTVGVMPDKPPITPEDAPEATEEATEAATE